MKVRFLENANVELDEAIDYYNHQLPGLGFRFFQEVSSAIDKILYMPRSWIKIGKTTRRYLIKGFPYALFYVIDSEYIVIVAVAHLHRDPHHYKARIV